MTGGLGAGLQAGAQATDLVFVLNNAEAIRAFSGMPCRARGLSLATRRHEGHGAVSAPSEGWNRRVLRQALRK